MIAMISFLPFEATPPVVLFPSLCDVAHCVTRISFPSLFYHGDYSIYSLCMYKAVRNNTNGEYQHERHKTYKIVRFCNRFPWNLWRLFLHFNYNNIIWGSVRCGRDLHPHGCLAAPVLDLKDECVKKGCSYYFFLARDFRGPNPSQQSEFMPQFHFKQVLKQNLWSTLRRHGSECSKFYSWIKFNSNPNRI